MFFEYDGSYAVDQDSCDQNHLCNTHDYVGIIHRVDELIYGSALMLQVVPGQNERPVDALINLW